MGQVAVSSEFSVRFADVVIDRPDGVGHMVRVIGARLLVMAALRCLWLMGRAEDYVRELSAR